MKKRIKIYYGYKKFKEKTFNYIPLRFIFATLITTLEVIAIIALVINLCIYIPYFSWVVVASVLITEIRIIASDDNPDYKIPWMFFVLTLPVIGLMLFIIFASRKLKPKFVRKLSVVKEKTYINNNIKVLEDIEKKDIYASNQARNICNIADTNVFKNAKLKYFSSGEQYFLNLVEDLKNASKFIYMEYFIIEEGKFWNTILDILVAKVKEGVDVKVIFDDIGCMQTLPGNYAKKLCKLGIEATTFSRLKGQADSEFNNRNHRKITVIDGYIGYTGGINLADEYINEYQRFGHWKDTGIRIEGEAVWEYTRLFLIDFVLNVKKVSEITYEIYPHVNNIKEKGFVVPFGDGPKPLYDHQIGKIVIQNMLASATKYAYMTSPYLIIDNDLCLSIENAALRGVDVKIIVPGIPDKKLVNDMTKSYYKRLMNAGVKIYEYKPGFIHAKTYIVDDKYAMVGTINLDYRSLVHHFENAIWIYDCECIKDIKKDVEETLEKSVKVLPSMLKTKLRNRIFRALVRVFAPLL